jgi:exopolysaccharide biosynthesis polyprenyl glycosylphosphotransferase
MSSDGLAFRLTEPTSFQGIEDFVPLAVDEKADDIVHVYAPEPDVEHLVIILARLKLPYRLNRYDISPAADGIFCFYRRRFLSEEQASFLASVAMAGGKVCNLLDYLEQRRGLVEVELLHGDYLLDNDLMRFALDQRFRWWKQLMDSLLATVLLCVTLPVWLLVALAIRLESPGPVFFHQRRTGLFNQEFNIIKFRSMYQDAEKDGARWAARNDSRITRVGAIIRRLRIDELPQLLNVLRGEMSIVGPRPEREVFIRDLEKQVPFYRFRHMVKPGVTGLAQVKYTYGASLEDAMHKHRYDLYYIKYHSLWLDMKILLHTVRIVAGARGV